MTPAYMRGEHRGFSTFEFQLELGAPLRAGDRVRVRSGVLHVGNSSLRLLHVMTREPGGEVVASLEQSGVHFDQDARRPAPAAPALRERALGLLLPRALMPLALGLFSMTTGPCSYPEGAARVARAAEAAGFESLWGGEHVVLPDPQAPPSPLAPEDPIIDPIVALAFVAAHTTRIRLGTGIIILPQRNPLVLAKQLATLDVLSAAG